MLSEAILTFNCGMHQLLLSTFWHAAVCQHTFVGAAQDLPWVSCLMLLLLLLGGGMLLVGVVV